MIGYGRLRYLRRFQTAGLIDLARRIKVFRAVMMAAAVSRTQAVAFCLKNRFCTGSDFPKTALSFEPCGAGHLKSDFRCNSRKSGFTYTGRNAGSAAGTSAFLHGMAVRLRRLHPEFCAGRGFWENVCNLHNFRFTFGGQIAIIEAAKCILCSYSFQNPRPLPKKLAQIEGGQL